MRTSPKATIVFLLLFTLLPFATAIAGEIPAAEELYQGVGIDPERVIYGGDPTESIDPFTGQLVLNYTDLALPGNGGLDLTINRNYYSKNFSWKISFGKISRRKDLVTVELPDGTVRYGYSLNSPANTEFLTKDFWKIHFPQFATEQDPPHLTMSDGTSMVFAASKVSAAGNIFYPTSIRKYSSQISIYYKTAGDLFGLPLSAKILDYVVDSVGRKVFFTHKLLDGTIIKPTAVSYCPDFTNNCNASDRISIEYKYGSFANSIPRLVEVKPPIGPSYHYDYAFTEAAYRLSSVVSPTGGVTEYKWNHFDKWIGSLSFRRFVAISQKTLTGRSIAKTTRTFNYTVGNADDFDYTTITDSSGQTTRIKYFGYKNKYLPGSENCWQVGLTKQVEVREKNGGLISRIDTEWEKASREFSNVKHKIAGLCSDSRTFIPRILRKTITRDNQQYSTSYESFDQYENPEKIWEMGDTDRQTVIGYWYNQGLNIVQKKPAKTTISSTAFPGTLSTQTSYNSTGLAVRIDRNGVITQNDYFPNGNMNWTRDAKGNTTHYKWAKGRISEIKNDQYPYNPVRRSINPDGTISSATTARGNTTSFEYDILGRLTKIIPPSTTASPNSPTTIGYLIAPFSYGSHQYQASTGKNVKRLAKYTLVSIDGLGRQTATVDDLNVTSTTVYRKNGLKDFTDSNIGDKTLFDKLGRVSSIIHKDNTSITYRYNKSNVIITDESGGQTTQKYTAFGDPDEKILTGIIDAAGNVTDYAYNIAGQLRQSSLNSTVVSQYGYNGNFFLTSETSPETGTIHYDRDETGNLTNITDALGSRSYKYDRLNRLTEISYGIGKITYSYDLDSNV